MIRVILAGEGKNELGGFALELAFRGKQPEMGVVEALLRQIRPDGFEVVDAILWKHIPKLQVGIGGKGEGNNVRRAYHHAKKRGCDVLAFTRDRDKEKFAYRDEEIERALAELKDGSGGGPRVIGGVAIEKLESWLAAIAGVHGSEGLRRPEQRLEEFGVREKDTAGMVRLVEEWGLESMAGDALSLKRWLERARDVLRPGEPQP